MKYYINIFKNNRKTEDNQPDYQMILTPTTETDNKDAKRYFGLWLKNGKNGKYFSGTLDMDKLSASPQQGGESDFDDDLPF